MNKDNSFFKCPNYNEQRQLLVQCPNYNEQRQLLFQTLNPILLVNDINHRIVLKILVLFILWGLSLLQ